MFWSHHDHVPCVYDAMIEAVHNNVDPEANLTSVNGGGAERMLRGGGGEGKGTFPWNKNECHYFCHDRVFVLSVDYSAQTIHFGNRTLRVTNGCKEYPKLIRDDFHLKERVALTK